MNTNRNNWHLKRESISDKGSISFLVCPVYASSKESLELVRKTALSIVRQTIDCICLFVDDESPYDANPIILEINSDRLRYVKRKKTPGELKHCSNALNYGFKQLIHHSHLISGQEKSRITSVGYIHCDDTLPDDSIERRSSMLSSQIAFVWGDRLYVDFAYNPIRYYQMADCNASNILSKGEGFSHHTILWQIDFFKKMYTSKSILHQIDGIYDPHLTAFEDVDVTVFSFLEASRLGLQTAYTQKINYFYLIHPSSISQKITSLEYERCRRIILNRYEQNTPWISIYWKILMSNLPWSLFHFLPEGIKRKFRKLKKNLQSEQIPSYSEKDIWSRMPADQLELIRDTLSFYRTC